MAKTKFNIWKRLQAIVSDPSASGNSLTFIKSISQDKNGVINPSKATVSTMTGASANADGEIGLVPKPLIADVAKFLKADGTWSSVPWSGISGKPSYYDAKAIKNITRSGTTFTATCMDDTTFTFTQQDNDHYAWSDITGKPSYYDAKAVKSITRSGTTFTATCMDNTTFTFTQQDNDHYAWSDITGKPSYYDAKAIKSITRSGNTFTYTCMDNTTGTFTQKDNDSANTAPSTSSKSGTGLTVDFYKFGKIVIGYLHGTTSAAYTKDATIVTADSGYRPAFDFWTPATIGSATTRLGMTTGGVVKLNAAVAKSTICSCVFVFYVS